MRIIGLDLGNRTVGVALSDYLGIIANPVGTFRFEEQDLDSALEQVVAVIKENQVEKIVLGLPKNMNGSIGDSGNRVIEFSELIKESLNIKVELWDERLTTVAAHKAMIEADLSRQKRKKIVDKIAAIYILQGYLDRLSNKK